MPLHTIEFIASRICLISLKIEQNGSAVVVGSWEIQKTEKAFVVEVHKLIEFTATNSLILTRRASFEGMILFM